MSGVTRDAFLGGRLTILQPARGYRAGVDPVLLASCVFGKPGESVLELGCGVGTALLCLAARLPGLSLTGIELQEDYAEFARENAAQNRVAMRIETADLTALPADLRNAQFDHVIMNPPYFTAGTGRGSRDPGRETARAGATPLADWLGTGARRLRPGGGLTLIQAIARLPDVMRMLPPILGSVQVCPIAGREGRAPDRFLLRAKHGGRAAFRLHPTLILHQGAEHRDGRAGFTPGAEAILREAAPLDIFE